MQRRSFVPGAALATAAALAATLTSCTGGSGSGNGATDTKGGDTAATTQSAEPGKYRTLPEPCGLPSRNTLRRLLPPGGEESPQDAEKVYAGTADITYDTDRRVGCRWKREAPDGTRHLSLDFERVVSYDPAVSDDDKAQNVYAKKELAAELPAATGSAKPTPSAGDKGGDGKPGAGGDGEDAGKTAAGGKASPAPTGSPSGSPSTDPSTDPSASPGSPTAPRVLDGLADAAFLNDKLITADSGVHRDVSIVFRSSNVIVTITYDRWSADKTALPDSKDLQDKAQALAQELADRFND
ncbi:hypothetical protein CP973_02770 [Streptomyces albofaciens JCM 4342]|uniref:hypothetical protein n=1 Tax=Streptomyces albofaciens TaxID=66866 RepID=UPI0012384D63|nr:hypothetical protein [Streptomyces albofaciens]KAA6221037.1 hypothetical protein CP973_02770 [Streptomyces albofaciens JCM 4342]